MNDSIDYDSYDESEEEAEYVEYATSEEELEERITEDEFDPKEKGFASFSKFEIERKFECFAQRVESVRNKKKVIPECLAISVELLLYFKMNTVRVQEVFDLPIAERKAKILSLTGIAEPREEVLYEDESVCEICFCDFDEEEPVSTQYCKHFFHVECVGGWAREKCDGLYVRCCNDKCKHIYPERIVAQAHPDRNYDHIKSRLTDKVIPT